jgi:hypothetical protein
LSTRLGTEHTSYENIEIEKSKSPRWKLSVEYISQILIVVNSLNSTVALYSFENWDKTKDCRLEFSDNDDHEFWFYRFVYWIFPLKEFTFENRNRK